MADINLEKFNLGRKIDKLMIAQNIPLKSAATQLDLSIGWASKARKYYLEQRTHVRPFVTELDYSIYKIQNSCTKISKILKKDKSSITNKDIIRCYRESKNIQDIISYIVLAAEDTDLIQEYHVSGKREEESDELTRKMHRSEFYLMMDWLINA